MVVDIINILGLYCLLISAIFFVIRQIVKVFMRNKEVIVFKRFYAIDLISLAFAVIIVLTLFSVSPAG